MAKERRYAVVLDEDDATALSEAFPQNEATCGAAFAVTRARLLLGCYPRGQAQDPETYVAAVSAVLADFSSAVVAAVTDPRSGVARAVKFLPAVAEIVDACEAEAGRRTTVGNLARQHLRLRHEPGYRQRLEAAIGYTIEGAGAPRKAEPELTPEQRAKNIQRLKNLLSRQEAAE